MATYIDTDDQYLIKHIFKHVIWFIFVEKTS